MTSECLSVQAVEKEVESPSALQQWAIMRTLCSFYTWYKKKTVSIQKLFS